MFANLRCGYETSVLRNVICAAQAEESSVFNTNFALIIAANRLEQRCNVVRVAADDVEELVLAGLEDVVVDVDDRAQSSGSEQQSASYEVSQSCYQC